MAEPARKLITVAEFLGFDDGTDRRHELIGGEIVMMSPPARAHGVLTARLCQLLSNRLRPPCFAQSEAGIPLPWSGHDYYQADVAVSCARFGPEPWCPDPVLIVEILSELTERKDRGVKLPAYRRLPSVRDILLVASEAVAVEHYARAGALWEVRDLGRGDAIRLATLGVDIASDELYAGLLESSGAPAGS